MKSASFPIYRPGRPYERMLIFFVSLIGICGIFMLHDSDQHGSRIDPAFAGFVIILSFWLLHGILVFRKEKGDELFLPLTAFLILLGWMEIYRLKPPFAFRQMVWILIGEAIFILWLMIVKDYKVLEDYKYIFLFGAVIVQVAVSLFGYEANGAKLWFRFKYFSIQPVEIVKLLLTIFLVSYLKQNRSILKKPLIGGDISLYKYYFLLFLLWGGAEMVLIFQKDLGMALLLFGVFMGLFYAATSKAWLTAIGFGLFFGGASVLYKIFSHVQVRVNNWLDPWAYADTQGYQMIQALYALANGGILGAGLGKGEPYYIPAVHTDYIFVAIAEEMGLVGALIVLSVFLVLIQRMFKTAVKAPDRFGSFLAFGLGVLFATQVFIIVGGAVKFIPLTGITLPFVSYGGSSLVSNFILLALCFQISARSYTGKEENE